ncbi:transcriptional regulator [Vibrio mediterranei]|uniref:Transcriptional regulator n=1 Tax=Vibrio mediterranei TaxID=689 RepID=A0A3G4V4X9_9VIBR|nr:transcriptional regulator [Vibrio mediterranei]AYV19823.1 transcriptional regulator [Vibrio mediterranei]AYV19826.1 transcriptional regulator [Vibrio mediterranei]
MKPTARFLASAINFDFTNYDVKSIHKLLFIGLSFLADDKQKVSVSTSELMEFCLSTRPTVLSAIKQLELVGLLNVERVSGDLSCYTVKPSLYFPQNRQYSEELVSYLLRLDLSQYKLKAIHKLILICMSSSANKDYSASLRVGELMMFCLATKPTVINGIKYLESQGLIVISSRAGSSNLYHLRLDFFPSKADKAFAALCGYPESLPSFKKMSFDEGVASEIKNSELSGLGKVVPSLLALGKEDRD